MARATTVGVGLFAVGLVGYVAGIFVAYPGRAFSLTAVMVGLTLAAISQVPSEADA